MGARPRGQRGGEPSSARQVVVRRLRAIETSATVRAPISTSPAPATRSGWTSEPVAESTAALDVGLSASTAEVSVGVVDGLGSERTCVVGGWVRQLGVDGG